ncbi:hypothetical protein VN97_g11276, partial [Penicillium thymicola]
LEPWDIFTKFTTYQSSLWTSPQSVLSPYIPTSVTK